MQTTIDSLANANSKAQLARLLVEERAAHAQEHREFLTLQHKVTRTLQECDEAKRDRDMYQAEMRILNRARDLLLRVVERLIEADDTQRQLIDSMRAQLTRTLPANGANTNEPRP
jgi:hypothetical protein